MKLQGKLTITKIQNVYSNVMRLDIVDEASRSRFLQADISPEDLLLAITSLADRPITFDLGGCDIVGKQQEIKRVCVPGIRQDIRGKAEWRKHYSEMVAPYEVDGWVADKETTSSHKWSSEGYEVIFRRWLGEGLGYGKVRS